MLLQEEKILFSYLLKILKEEKIILIDDLVYKLLYNYGSIYLPNIDEFIIVYNRYFSILLEQNFSNDEKTKITIQLIYKDFYNEFKNKKYRNNIIFYLNHIVYKLLLKNKLKILKPSNIIIYEE